MNCIYCKATNAGCTDSRPSHYAGNFSRRRRWWCKKCDERFTTCELATEDLERIIETAIRDRKIIENIKTIVNASEEVGDV